MLRGPDDPFGGHTAVRIVNTQEVSKAVAGYQFNLTVRRRVSREDGDEYLFDFHTVVVKADGDVDEALAAVAASSYGVDESPNAIASAALNDLNLLSVDSAFESARAFLDQRIKVWDWDEEVDLIGVAKIVFQPANV